MEARRCVWEGQKNLDVGSSMKFMNGHKWMIRKKELPGLSGMSEEGYPGCLLPLPRWVDRQLHLENVN